LSSGLEGVQCLEAMTVEICLAVWLGDTSDNGDNELYDVDPIQSSVLPCAHEGVLRRECNRRRGTRCLVVILPFRSENRHYVLRIVPPGLRQEGPVWHIVTSDRDDGAPPTVSEAIT
jgi:hypothetical protein